MSVVIPVYNGERFIAEAIESVLDQTAGDLELIVSDNASTDGTEVICRGYEASDPRVRYMRATQNVGAAMNYRLGAKPLLRRSSNGWLSTTIWICSFSRGAYVDSMTSPNLCW